MSAGHTTVNAGPDAAYPELLRDLAQLVAQAVQEAGIESARAAAIGETAAEHVRDAFGGQVVYVPKGAAFATRQRWERIWQDFTGHNHNELAAQYGMGVHGIYKVLAIMRAEHARRAQPDMFLAEKPEAA